MWKDSTSYSRDDKERVQTAWTAESGPVRITVTCGHIHYRPEWVMHCYAVGIDTLHMKGCTGPEDAQRRAVELVKAKAREIEDNAARLSV